MSADQRDRREEQESPVVWTDRAIEVGALFLLVFAPLAFGTVNPWAEAIAEVVILAMVLLWLVGMVRQWELRIAMPPGALPAVLFLALGLLQALALPTWLTELLSPRAAALAQEVADFTGRPVALVASSLAPYVTWQHWMKLLGVGLFFLVVYNAYRTRDQVRRLLWTMLIIAAFISLFGIVQRVTWNGRLYWIGPLSPGASSFGPFVNPAHFAGLIVVVVPMGLAMMLGLRREPVRRRFRRSWRDRLRAWNSRDVGPRRLVPLTILLAGGAALASGSRGGIVSLGGALIAMAGLSAGRRGGRRHGAMLLATLVLLVLAAAWIGGDILYGSLEELAKEAGTPHESIRVKLWSDAVGVWRDAPFLGTGLGSFAVAFEPYRTVQAPVVFTHAESDWVQLLTDTGLIGLVLVIGVILALAVRLLHVQRRAGSLWDRALARGALVAVVGTVLQWTANYNLLVMSNLLYLAAAVAVALPLEPDEV